MTSNLLSVRLMKLRPSLWIDLDVGAVVEIAGARAVVADEPQHQRVELDRA